MPDPLPPRQYVVRKPAGDPHAARTLAAAYDALADDVTTELGRAVVVLTQLHEGWQGAGAGGSQEPEQVVAADAQRVAHALRRSADDLRHFAHRLEQAHERHGWSLGKLVALGAMVAVGTAAVVVTIGAAAPAEAAAAAAAVETAEAAATAAGAASAGVAADLSAWQTLLANVRPLTPFLLPHAVSAGSSAGLDATAQLVSTHHLDLHALEVSAVAGFAGSATGELIEQRLLAMPSLVRRAAEGSAWAASGSVASYADTGDVEAADALSLGLTGLVARDVRFGVDEARLMWKLRVPQLPLGLDTKKQWRGYVTRMYAALDAAGRRDATIVWRGSSITGFNFREGHPFDSLYRSDWDLALVDDRAYEYLRVNGMRGPESENRTFTLKKNKHLRALGLLDVTRELSALAGRQVTWMVYKDVAAVDARQGRYLIVPRP